MDHFLNNTKHLLYIIAISNAYGRFYIYVIDEKLKQSTFSQMESNLECGYIPKIVATTIT